MRLHLRDNAVFGIVAGLSLALGPGGCAPTTDSIFNGRDLSGWHISETSRHGRTEGWDVESGVLIATQQPAGVGGVLLTDQQYGSVEVSLEVLPDFGCDSGLLLRSNEDGAAYQVLLDYLEGGNIGGVFGEGLPPLDATLNDQWTAAWRSGEWNRMRARIEDEVPRIRVWINETLVTDWTDTANHAVDGATKGAIGLQVHGGSRWSRGGRIRFRNVTVSRLD